MFHKPEVGAQLSRTDSQNNSVEVLLISLLQEASHQSFEKLTERNQEATTPRFGPAGGIDSTNTKSSNRNMISKTLMRNKRF